jgi:hypothetical protein
VLCSAPSASLGGDRVDGYRGSFRLHQFAASIDGDTRLTRTERMFV